MNYFLAVTLPPVLMFASISAIEKVMTPVYNDKSNMQKNAITAVLSRIITLLLVMVPALFYILLDAIRHQQLNEYYVDYTMGAIITTNTYALLWNAHANNMYLPINQVILAYIMLYHVISNPQTLLYYASFMITVFSTLRVTDDVAALYHSERLYRLNTYIRKTEEFSMYGFFVLNPSKISIGALCGAFLVLPWLYSDDIEKFPPLYFANRKRTTAPMIMEAARNHPLLVDTSEPVREPASSSTQTSL